MKRIPLLVRSLRLTLRALRRRQRGDAFAASLALRELNRLVVPELEPLLAPALGEEQLRRAWGGDRFLRFELLRKWAELAVPEYRFADLRLDWYDDAAFADYLRRFGEEHQLNSHRRWMVAHLLRLTAHVEGDTAECGALRGAMSWLICAANLDGPKTHHVFDSFEGLSEPGETDTEHWARGDLACSLEEVREGLREFERVEYHKAWIPDGFAAVADRRFSFVHIDVDLAQPTADSLAFFYPRTTRGGIVVCDDYGSALCPGATSAVERYLADKEEKMIALPDGGGLLIKGVRTGPPPRFDLARAASPDAARTV